MSTRGFFLRMVMATLLGCCLNGAAAASLNIEFTDESGRKVVPSSAELLLVAWGETKRLALPLENGNLQLSMDADWLRARWPERFADLEKAYLYFRADGFAPLRSEAFQWIGTRTQPDGKTVPAAVILLPPKVNAIVTDDQSARLRVVMRKPQLRRLRILDTARLPIEGVKVRMGMFWSASNHCGVLSGNDALAAAVSDRDGLVAVPDGDVEYAFEFDKLHYVLADAGSNSFSPPRLITKLDTNETVVTMRRLASQPLTLQATANGMPVAGRTLMATRADCGCGACSGPLGTTDAGGQIRIAEFYPGQYSELWFDAGNGQALWRRDIGKLDVRAPVRAELTAP